MQEKEVEVEAVMVLKKKLKLRTVHSQIFMGSLDVYECPSPYVIIMNVSTEHEHSVRMDVYKEELAMELRLWLEGKVIRHPMLIVPQRIEEAMTKFVKFGKAPLQEDLLMWIASRTELMWANGDDVPDSNIYFGGVPQPSEEYVIY